MTAFPFNLYGGAFLGAMVVTWLCAGPWQRWSLRHGLTDDPGGRKTHDAPVALSGGLAILTGLVVPLLAGAIWLHSFEQPEGGILGPGTADLIRYGLDRRTAQLAVLLGGAAGMALLGWLDDRHELGPGVKFCGQAAIAILVATSGVRVTLFVDNAVFSYGITLLWILTVTNACNFLDNMNGLCAGLGLIASWSLAWHAAVGGQFLVAAIAFLACGALLGFLPFNFPNARCFLGDAGSHLVGYLLAVLAILPSFHSQQHPQPLAVLKPLLILGVFLADMIWVVGLRLKLGRPVYVGDTNHLSHQLVRAGCSRTQAVLLLWLGGAGLAWLASQV